MSTPRTVPGLTFRTRLALSFTALFVVAGAAMLVVQNLLVSNLFTGAISTTTAALTITGGQIDPVHGELVGVAVGSHDPAAGSFNDYLISGVSVPTWFGQQSKTVASDVMSGLVWWSVATLAGFALVAAGLAWWLARRSMRRIGAVTGMARSLSMNDLDQRLDLAGPDDEIKELADTFDAMLDRLQDSFSRQDRFVANASHELRTPLTTARTALEIPLAQNRVPADLQPALRTALRAGQQSENLISSLLVLARGRTISGAAPGDLGEIATDTVIDARLRWPTSTVDIQLTTTPAPICAELTMIGRAVGNLVDNALLHNVPHGRIWVDVRVAGDFAVLEVENTGQLLDPAEIALLGEPFYRGGASRTHAGRPHSLPEGGRSGVGLGLSIVSSIVTAHQGRLTIIGRDGGGLRIEARLPLAPSTGQQAEPC